VRLEKGPGRDNRLPKQAAGQPSELPEGGHSMSSSNRRGQDQCAGRRAPGFQPTR
jgi:hypothetical protein